MRRTLGALAILAVFPIGGGEAPAGEPVAFPWQRRGFAALVPAAAQARTEGHRLLLGLSGGET